GDMQKYDLKRRSGSLGSSQGLIFERDNEINIPPNELSCGDAGSRFICEIPEVQSDVFPFLVSPSLQAFAQPIKRRRNVVQAYVKEANSPNPSCLLRLTTERRGEKGEGEQGDDQPLHGTSRWPGCCAGRRVPVNAGRGGGDGMPGEPRQPPAHGHFLALGSLGRVGELSPPCLPRRVRFWRRQVNLCWGSRPG